MFRSTFQNRENADAYAREQRAAGRRVTRRTARNVQLSPDYVADYTGTPTPNGFGGTSPEYFSRVYIVEAR